jgi:fructose-specific phosphotransferase system IIA component
MTRFSSRPTVPRILIAVCLLVVAPALLFAVDNYQDVSVTHEVTRLLLGLGVVILAAKGGGAVAKRLGVPALLGEVTAGLALGPYALGSIALPSFPNGLVPLAEGAFPVSLQLYGFAAVGAVVHVLQVGLDSDSGVFTRARRRGLPVALGSSLLSLIVGALVPILFFGLPLFDRRVIFFAALSVSTSLGIQARILHEHHKMATPEGVAVVSSSLMQDGFAIVFLAIALAVGGIELGRDGDADLMSTVLPVALMAVGALAGGGALAFFGAPRLSAMFRDRLSPNLFAVVVVGITLLISALFEALGVASIIGAYIIGIAFSRTDMGDVLAEKVQPISDFFVPVLYVVMGMLVDWRVLFDLRILLPGVGFALLSGAAKIVGSGVPALMTGFNRLGALRVGLGTVCRGEVALIIASVGLALGDFSSEIFQIMVVMIVLSVALGAPALSASLRRPGSGTRGRWGQRDTEVTKIDLPNEELSDLITDGLLRVAEEDGFFVHRLELAGKVYRLRRNEVYLTINRDPTSIRIVSDPRDTGIAKTLLYEVIVHVRDRVARIAEVTVPKELRRDVAGGGASNVQLSDYISPAAATVLLEATDKEGVIQELVDRLARAGRITDSEQVLADVMEREATVSTGMEKGLAIPHARTRGVKGMAVAVGVSREGIEFQALDGKPTHLVFLIASSPDDRGPHLQLLAAIAKQMRNEQRIAAAVQSENETELVAAILSEEPIAEVSQNI